MKWKITLIIIGALILIAGGLFFMDSQGMINLPAVFQEGIRSYDLIKVDSFETKDGYTKNYTTKDENLVIENSSGTIISLKLISSPKNIVIGGRETLIAEFTLEDYLNSNEEIFDSIIFYDIINGNKTISKNIQWKYREDYQVLECGSLNEFNESLKGINDCQSITKTNWTSFSSLSELPSKNINIGLFTDSKLKDKIEWIPIIKGFEIKEWALYEVSTAVFDNINLSVGTETSTPRGMFFKPDGTILYVTGQTSSFIFQYNLSVPWDISTAVNGNVNVSSTDSVPQGLFFNDSGNRMYVVGSTADTVRQYNLTVPWVVSTAVSSLVTSTLQEATPTGVYFNATGTKMYITGATGLNISEYNLTVPWVVSSAVFFTNVSVNLQDATPSDLYIKNDGKTLWMIGQTNARVYQYDLPIAWKTSTMVWNGSSSNLSVTLQDAAPTGISFETLGGKMYIVGAGNDKVYQYTLPSPIPQWSLNSTNDTTSGTRISHSVYWTDDINLSGYIFSFYNGTKTNVVVSNTSIYNFSDTTNNKAYNWTGQSQQRWLNNASVLEMPTGGYTNLANLGATSGNASCTAVATNDYCLIRFVFDIVETPSTISWINITVWGGEGVDDVSSINVYNWTGNKWTNFSTNLSTTYGRNGLNISNSDVVNYIGANGNITILVDNPAVLQDVADASPQKVDYISVDITYNSTIALEIFTNDTFATFTGTTNWSNVTKYVNETVGSVIKWKVFANDSFNQLNQTSIFQYTTTSATDTTSPQWSSNSTTGTIVGTTVYHNITWTDNTALSSYYFEFDNGTGTLTNDTLVTFTGTTNYSNVSKVINTTVGSTIRWRVYANDSSNNLNRTSLFSYITTALASNCWVYDSVGKMLIIPTDCVYVIPTDEVRGI